MVAGARRCGHARGVIEQPPKSTLLPVVASTEKRLVAAQSPSPEALENARRRALDTDRALAELRASFREAPPAATMPRPTPKRGRERPEVAPPRQREPDPAAELRRLLLDAHEAFCRGRHADALMVYEQACHVAPARVAGYLGLARTLLALGRFGEARDAYRHALDIEPENVAARDGLADCEWRMDLPSIEPFSPPVRRPRARAPISRQGLRRGSWAN